jgi:peptide/nickel transport system permease protein
VVIGVAVLGVFGGGIVNLSLLLVLFSWGEYARVVRSQTLAVKEQEYVMAAQTLGATGSRVVFRHILPSVLALTIVVFTLQLPHLIILESGLSFLGVGVRPPTPSLGNIIAEARSYLEIAWWVAAVPGIWLSLIVLSANIFGDWLRDIADPRMRGLVATQVGR